MSYVYEYEVKRGFETVKDLYEMTLIHTDRLGYIGGSYAAFMAGFLPKYPESDLLTVLPNDVDIFATSRWGAEMLVERLEAYGYFVTSASDHVWSLGRSQKIGFEAMSVQVVEPKPEWISEDSNFPLSVINDFDLACSRALLLKRDIVLADESFSNKYNKILRINNPLRTLKRVMKYHNRGFDFEDSELIKILNAWDALSQERKTEIRNLAATSAYEEEYDYEDEWSRDYEDEWSLDDDDWFAGE